MIDQNSLKKLLEHFSIDLGVSREIDGEGRKDLWIPIHQYRCPSTSLTHSYGLLSSGDWTPEFGDKKRVRPPCFWPSFFVLLESDKHHVVEQLKESIADLGLPEVVLYTFPFDSIIIAALSDHRYWRNCAEKWINEGYPLNEGLAELIPKNKAVLAWKQERLNILFDI